MTTERTIHRRRSVVEMGQVLVGLAVENAADASKRIESIGLVEPLVGYTVLESCGAVVDLVTHRLVARKYYDLKSLRAA